MIVKFTTTWQLSDNIISVTRALDENHGIRNDIEEK